MCNGLQIIKHSIVGGKQWLRVDVVCCKHQRGAGRYFEVLQVNDKVIEGLVVVGEVR